VLGWTVGCPVGADDVGAMLGCTVGFRVGPEVGGDVGAWLGLRVGSAVGEELGTGVGEVDGAADGTAVGDCEQMFTASSDPSSHCNRPSHTHRDRIHVSTPSRTHGKSSALMQLGGGVGPWVGESVGAAGIRQQTVAA